ncbi:hypothetical protein AAG906_016603 [Vitis piasezkii]
MGYKVGGLPSTYLGLPLVVPSKFVAIWDGVKEISQRLAILTLIQSNLSSMPIYFMALFCIPRQVRLRLEKIQRDFLCGAMNKALLCECSRHFAIERRALWKPVIGQSTVKMKGAQGRRVYRDENDRLVWAGSRNRSFSVKSLYHALEPGDPLLFPRSIIWRYCAPPKVVFFVGGNMGRILTLVALSLFGVAWALSFSVKETLLRWHGSFVVKAHKKAWKVALLCIFWTVWKERNLLVFDNTTISIHRVKSSFVYNLWSWFRRL